jgi:cellulose synthase/poly-beta-1,6-N-acetylglucosamine synthase-like glycosyltransferase
MLNEPDILSWIITGLLALVVLIQLYYLWSVFAKVAFFKEQKAINHRDTYEPVSIIIAARNELENLEKNLTSILEQDYPDFEVIVVNHCSWDSSQAYLEELQKQYKHLKVSQLIEQEKYPTGKKFALTIGIKAAKYEWLLFTDADCKPASNQWIKSMQQQFTSDKEIVLGYSPYTRKSGLLNLFIRFETLITAMFYFGLAIKRNPFMGVGRNLAYRKSLFFRAKGFASHQHILSGDDDLFVNKAANKHNVAIQIQPESFVYTEPKTSFDSYSRQKSRHLSTGKYYKSNHRNILSGYYISLFLFYLSTTALLVYHIQMWPIAVALFALRFISQEVVFYLNAKRFNCTRITPFIIVLDVLYVFYLLTFGVKGLFTRNKKHW